MVSHLARLTAQASSSSLLSREASAFARTTSTLSSTLRPHNLRNHARQQVQARSFHVTRPSQDFHFDTHHFVQRLEREGLNRAQAEGIMSAMAEVIDESIRNITSNMVTKTDQEKVRVHHLRVIVVLPIRYVQCGADSFMIM